ncbi:type-F conjugative transfer system pilin assembly protein TrbC [Novosphingobium sp. PY1]|uniref:type-F conjugative transfer system pilin assembly protein TrbC n=1 Tax=Novosphingobium sp. PY1 TaxID=1882221 RepID=UPI001AA3B883|nr:type-F conjugative transfer system pilin assembly protein TrbC [Novosphingobium sp. PY1]GFM31018.1 type-F conjugative transfer system pilin assembly protein TrbC [Novosphingobium sp. PY1]
MPTSLDRDLADAGLRTGMFCASGAHVLEVRSAPVLEPTHSRSGLSQIRNGRTLALVVLSLFVPAFSALSQEALANEAPRTGRPVAQQGTAAMEQLKQAVSRQKTDTVSGPTALPDLPDEQRRRAFDGLRARTPSPELEMRARAGLEAAREGVAAERKAMARRMAQALGLDAPGVMPLAQAVPSPSAKGWVPVLFASSSMPVAVLRTYAGQLEKAGGVMAFRGMPGGLTHVGPMAKLSAQILRIDPGCEGPACAMRDVQIIVDPLVFRQHGVTRVPALAMIPGDPAQPYCERDDNTPVSPHVIYGDAALSGMLEEYARLGGRQEVRDAATRLENR